MLNVHSALCQLYLNKTGKNKGKEIEKAFNQPVAETITNRNKC